MPVTPRGKSWQATVHHQGARYRETFPTEAEALAWEARTKAALLTGESLPERNDPRKSLAPKTLGELFDLTYRKRPTNHTYH